MNEIDNDYLSIELLSEIEKIKIEMIISHIVLIKLSGQNSEDFQNWTSFNKRSYLYRLFKNRVSIKAQSKKK